jgi:competence protein ComEC
MADVTSSKPLALHLLDVGQGEAILIDFPDGSFGLIDAGPRRDATVVLAHLERRRAKNRLFRFAVVTQWDRDHAAGMPAVLRAHQPGFLYTPGIDLGLLETLAGGDASILKATRRACNGTVEEKFVNARDHLFTPEGVALVALSPYANLAGEIMKKLRPGLPSEQIKRFRNRTSLVLWMAFFGTTLLLAGEVESDQYDTMEHLWHAPHDPIYKKYGQPHADWIKLSHHGAEKNNSPRLFQCFAKEAFVASASAGGRYGHPHPLTLNRVREAAGRAMCTRLGTGCALIVHQQLNPSCPDQWLGHYKPLAQLRNPRKSCFGTVTVEVTPTGPGLSRCTVRGESTQPKCPYGGPPEGELVLRAG